MKALCVSRIASCISACVLGGPTVSVNDLQPSNVKGRLGKPLGTRATIEGYYTPAMLSNPLKVTRIDGVAATNNIVISIRSRIPLKEGVPYRFEGYESGKFESAPGRLSPGVQQPFQFYSFFVVTHTQPPAQAPLKERLDAISSVFDSLAAALDQIRTKYPEMTGYRKENAKGQSEEAVYVNRDSSHIGLEVILRNQRIDWVCER